VDLDLGGRRRGRSGQPTMWGTCGLILDGPQELSTMAREAAVSRRDRDWRRIPCYSAWEIDHHPAVPLLR
jgi:hypothetical protein